MSLRKKLTIIGLSLTILITTTSGTASAKSVYVIADTGTTCNDTGILQAYRIEEANLAFQTEYLTQHKLPIAIAIDAENDFLFVTHEEECPSNPGNVIEIVDAKTMEYVDTVTAIGAANLAGIII